MHLREEQEQEESTERSIQRFELDLEKRVDSSDWREVKESDIQCRKEGLVTSSSLQ